jgi:hypothetical protein
MEIKQNIENASETLLSPEERAAAVAELAKRAIEATQL